MFLSQRQYRNENQNFIANFIFQLIKKKKKTRNGNLGTRIQNIGPGPNAFTEI